MPNPAYVIIPFFNNEKLTALQNYLKQRFADVKGFEAIQWQDPATFHITLCYHEDIEDADLDGAIITGFSSFEVLAHRENHNGLEFFSTEDGLALYANVAESEKLRDLQALVYAGFPEAGISPHSNPAEWTPHITMAYLPNDFEIPPTDYDPIPLSVEKVTYNRDDYTPFATVSANQRNRHMKRKIQTSTHILPALRDFMGQAESLIASIFKMSKEQRASYDFWMLYDMAWEWLEMRYEYPFIEGGYLDDDGRLYIEFTDNGKLYRLPILMMNGQVSFGTAEQIVIDRVPVSEMSAARVVHIKRVSETKVRGVAIANTAVLNRIGVIDSTEMYDQMERRFNEFMATNPSEDQLPYIDLRHFNSRYNTDAFTMGRIHQVWRYQHQLHIAFEIDVSTELGRVAEQRLADGTWGISIEFLALNAREETIGNVPILIYTDGKLTAASILEERDAASYFTFIEAQETYRMAMTDEQLKKTVSGWLGNESDANAFIEAAQLPERQIERDGLITRDNAETSETADTNTQDAPATVDAPSEETVDEDPVDAPALELDEAAMDALAERVSTRIEALVSPLRQRLEAVEESIRSAANGSQAAMEEFSGILAEMNADIEALQREDTERLNEIINGQSREQRRAQTQNRQQRIQKVTFRPTANRQVTDKEGLPDTPAPDEPEQKEGFGGAMRIKGGKPASAGTGAGDATVSGFGGAGAKRKTK
jgi:2'-5' RNA ligase